jgi:hypothetical protein
MVGIRMDGRFLATWATLAVFAGPACGAQVPSFDGTYAIASAGGVVTLWLHTLPSGEVRGWLQGADARFDLEGALVTDDDGDLSVEGTLSGSGLRTDFVLYREEGDAYGLLLVPYDRTGTPRSDQATVHQAARIASEGATAAEAGLPPVQDAPPPGAAPPGVARDSRLVGTWSSQVIMNSAAGSIATELWMQIRPDGVMLDLGSRGMGDVGGGILDTGLQTGGDQALWRTEGALLFVSLNGSAWVPFARFEVSGPRLLLTYLHDGSRQIWSRRTGG